MDTVRSYISSYRQIPRATPVEPLYRIIGRVTGSHDGIFVFGDDGVFAGVIWMYHVLYHRRPMRTGTAGQYAVMPPEIRMQSGIYDAVRAMLSLRLYTLPVVDGNGHVIGALTARTMLTRMLENGFFSKVKTAIVPSKPFVTGKDDKLRSIYSRMRRHGRSRAVAVDESQQLAGLVTRRDIYSSMIAPVSKPRMKTAGGRKRQLLFDREWPQNLDRRMRQLYTHDVVTARESEDMEAVFERMLTRGVASSVIIDQDRHPQAMVSMRSFLKAVADQEKHTHIPIEIVDAKSVLSVFRRIEMQDMLTAFAGRMHGRDLLRGMHLTVDSLKNAADKVSRYSVTVRATLKRGGILIAKDQQYELRPAVRSVLSKLRRQLA